MCIRSDRELVAWNGGEPPKDLLLQGNAQGWCQFSDQANAGVESTFDMDVYTSKVDPSKSRYTEEEADRIAREIEKDQKSMGTTLDDSGVPTLSPLSYKYRHRFPTTRPVITRQSQRAL